MEENEKKVFEPVSDMPEQEHEEPDCDATTDEEVLKGARRNMHLGLLWCVGGLAFTFLSYYLTEAGGHYVIATGAIVWGAIQALNGLTAYVRIMRARGESGACKKAIVTAVCTALAIAGAGYQSWRMVQAEDTPLIDHEQPYDCPELGIRFTVPTGFTAITTEHTEETDSTYAVYRIRTFSPSCEIYINGVSGLGESVGEDFDSVDDIAGFLNARAERFFPDGQWIENKIEEINGIRFLKHVGHFEPNSTTTTYHTWHNGLLLSFNFETSNKGGASKETEAFLQTLETY